MQRRSKQALALAAIVSLLTLGGVPAIPVWAEIPLDESMDNTARGGSHVMNGGNHNQVIGIGAEAGNGQNNTAVGMNIQVVGGNHNEGVGVGAQAVAGTGNTAIGTNAQVINGNNNRAVGYGAQAGGGNYNTAIGQEAQAINGNDNRAVGMGAFAGNGDYNTAVGAQAVAVGYASSAFGAQAQAISPGSVAIGAGSIANQADTVSVGTSEYQRRITNVAPGIYGTDAVNVSQLNNLDGKVNRLGSMAFAMSALAPMAYDPNNPTQYSAGVGTYNGTQGVAFGVFHYTKEDVMLNAAIGISSDGWEKAGRAGITWKTGSKAKKQDADTTVFVTNLPGQPTESRTIQPTQSMDRTEGNIVDRVNRILGIDGTKPTTEDP